MPMCLPHVTCVRLDYPAGAQERGEASEHGNPQGIGGVAVSGTADAAYVRLRRESHGVAAYRLSERRFQA